jgi:hypothetical protein
MFRFKVSEWLEFLLNPKIRVAESVMLLFAANGLAPVKGPNAPLFTLPFTLDDGMLSPLPSVSAAAALVKYAYVVAVPALGFSVQAVVTLITALPVAVPLGTSAKFTRPGDAVTVKDVVNVPLRLTLPTNELTCARAGATAKSTKRNIIPRPAVRSAMQARPFAELVVCSNIILFRSRILLRSGSKARDEE